MSTNIIAKVHRLTAADCHFTYGKGNIQSIIANLTPMNAKWQFGLTNNLSLSRDKQSTDHLTEN